MKTEESVIGIEHLLAAAVIAAGGTLTISEADITSPEMNGKVFALDYERDTITIRLVENDGYSE